MYFVKKKTNKKKKLAKFNESEIFQVSEIFPGVLSVFWCRCFDTDTFQRAILYQKEGYHIFYIIVIIFSILFWSTVMESGSDWYIEPHTGRP